MSRVFFDELSIPNPDFNLEIGSGTHGAQTGRMLEAIERVILDQRPDAVLVYGDTNSTLAGALVGAKLHIPVAHVEAGLRSFNRRMPEELNRIVADHVSDLLFTPTATADQNLQAEGISAGIHRVGDVMYDAVLFYRNRATNTSNILKTLRLEPKCFALATIHRAENTDDPERLKNILKALASIASKLPVVFPVHPRTRKILELNESANTSASASGTGILFTDPVSYLEMLVLESEAKVILTDSGGVQKEAYFFGVPCITLRAETEWVETVEAGWNTLVDDDVDAIIYAALHPHAGSSTQRAFGDGDAGDKIARILMRL